MRNQNKKNRNSYYDYDYYDADYAYYNSYYYQSSYKNDPRRSNYYDPDYGSYYHDYYYGLNSYYYYYDVYYYDSYWFYDEDSGLTVYYAEEEISWYVSAFGIGLPLLIFCLFSIAGFCFVSGAYKKFGRGCGKCCGGFFEGLGDCCHCTIKKGKRCCKFVFCGPCHAIKECQQRRKRRAA